MGKKKPTHPRRLVQLKWSQHTRYADFSPINTSGNTYSNGREMNKLPLNGKIDARNETNCKIYPRIISAGYIQPRRRRATEDPMAMKRREYRQPEIAGYPIYEMFAQPVR